MGDDIFDVVWRFWSKDKLLDHFHRHWGALWTTSATQYQNMANTFLNWKIWSNTLEIIRTNGDIVRYDPISNIFGVADKDGIIRTLYKLDTKDKLKYFYSQKR